MRCARLGSLPLSVSAARPNWKTKTQQKRGAPGPLLMKTGTSPFFFFFNPSQLEARRDSAVSPPGDGKRPRCGSPAGRGGSRAASEVIWGGGGPQAVEEEREGGEAGGGTETTGVHRNRQS